jgi:hypothetical protein
MNTEKNQKLVTWLIIGGIVICVIGYFLLNLTNDRRGGTGACNNNYVGTCVPNVKQDIDCREIDTSVNVVSKDVYNFDADHDGLGCESNGN